MSTVFSDTTNNLGMLQQVRSFARVDSTQWPTYKVVNSLNHRRSKVVGYALGADRRFQWDDTNHTRLPEGRTDLTINVTDYSFLTDVDGNPILTLLGISILQNGYYVPLQAVDRTEVDTSTFGFISGTPTQYDKIADNIIRLDAIPSATVTNGLKFYFQRAGSDYAATDTTKTTGCNPLLDRGFIIAGAYDCALTLGLENREALYRDLQTEDQFMIEVFSNRNRDEVMALSTESVSFR